MMSHVINIYQVMWLDPGDITWTYSYHRTKALRSAKSSRWAPQGSALHKAQYRSSKQYQTMSMVLWYISPSSGGHVINQSESLFSALVLVAIIVGGGSISKGSLAGLQGWFVSTTSWSNCSFIATVILKTWTGCLSALYPILETSLDYYRSYEQKLLESCKWEIWLYGVRYFIQKRIFNHYKWFYFPIFLLIFISPRTVHSLDHSAQNLPGLRYVILS